jgi:hypothetical protein
MNEEIKEELNEEIDADIEVAEDEEFETSHDDYESDDDVEVDEFNFDDDGNIVVPEEKTTDSGNNDNNPVNENDNEPTAEATPKPDSKDDEIERLRKQLSERDAQIRETLKSLGANEDEGVEGLEKLAAEAEDLTLEEYRQKKTERISQEEAKRLVQRQKFEEKKRADLIAVQQEYPDAKKYNSVEEFPHFAKFAEMRDKGLSPAEAYLVANSKGVISNVVDSTKQSARNLSSTKEHLRSNVPAGAKDKSITISKRQMAEYRDLFPDMSDKELVALYKQTMKK